MAIKFMSREYADGLNDYLHNFICDTEADVKNLPASATGSVALVVESGAIYMVNASGDWALFGG